VLFPRFDLDANPEEVGSGRPVGAGVVHRGVPYREINGVKYTTVYDIMLAHYGVNRPELNLSGSWPEDFHDATEVGTRRGRKPSRVSQPTPPFVSAANLRKTPQIPKAAHKSSWARASTTTSTQILSTALSWR